jgi:hypothetical protein
MNLTAWWVQEIDSINILASRIIFINTKRLTINVSLSAETTLHIHVTKRDI